MPLGAASSLAACATLTACAALGHTLPALRGARGPPGTIAGTMTALTTLTDRLPRSPDADPASAVAGDDAAEVGWFTPDEVRALDCAPGLVEALDGWCVLDDRGSG